MVYQSASEEGLSNKVLEVTPLASFDPITKLLTLSQEGEGGLQTPEKTDQKLVEKASSQPPP